jgi:hypothetical protein
VGLLLQSAMHAGVEALTEFFQRSENEHNERERAARLEAKERLSQRLAALQKEVEDFRDKEPSQFVAKFLNTPEWAAVIGRGKRLAFSPAERPRSQASREKKKRAPKEEDLCQALVQCGRAFALDPRWQNPRVAVALWLASSESSFVTGEALTLDGGLTAGRRNASAI